MIIHGDCLEVMTKYPDNYFSAVVTDPPYGLKFMGKQWDHGIPGIEFWQQALRVAKPGSFLLAFGGTRTFHRLTCAIEDAGWEIRDCIFWCYGQGFPKSHNFGCKCRGDTLPYSHEKTTKSPTESSLRSLQETNLSPEINSIDQQGKVLFSSLQEQSSQTFGTMSSQGIEERKESCMEGWNNIQAEQGQLYRSEVCEMSNRVYIDGEERRLCDGTSISHGETSEQNIAESGSSSSQGSQHTQQLNRKPRIVPRQSDTQNNRMAACEKCGGLINFKGFGTALKPSVEPIIMAMKPCDGTFAKNAEKWGQAGINIDEARIEGKRWPANILFDESSAAMLDEQSGISKSPKSGIRKASSEFGQNSGWNDHKNIDTFRLGHNDSGGASRFFYCAKASPSERGENNHPTVKPLKLMEYLIKLVMPPKDGILLDPFAGSGTTIVAAKNLGYEAVGIELEQEYCEIANKRIESVKNEQQLALF